MIPFKNEVKNMRYMNKKGQGAMEYLMTYGWAIMVVLIVGIVLWQLGIFNLGGTSKTFTGFGAVKPLSWAVPGGDEQSGVVTMVNGEGSTVTPSGCSISFSDVDVSCENCTISATSVGAGSEFLINLTNCSGGLSGDSYDATLSVNYTKRIGIITEPHTSTGNLKGPFE